MTYLLDQDTNAMCLSISFEEFQGKYSFKSPSTASKALYFTFLTGLQLCREVALGIVKNEDKVAVY